MLYIFWNILYKIKIHSRIVSDETIERLRKWMDIRSLASGLLSKLPLRPIAARQGGTRGLQEGRGGYMRRGSSLGARKAPPGGGGADTACPLLVQTGDVMRPDNAWCLQKRRSDDDDGSIWRLCLACVYVRTRSRFS